MNYPQLWRSSGLCFCLLFGALTTSRVEAETHLVHGGETFTSIARQHKISLATLQKLNPKVNPRLILRGQLLVVPDSSDNAGRSRSAVASRGKNQASKSFGPSRTSLGSGKPDNVKADSDKSASSRTSRKDSAGSATASKPKAAGAIASYKVKKGDTLTSIAGKKDLSVKELMAMNHLKDSHLSLGQTLLVPTTGPTRESPRESSSRDSNIVDISPPGPRSRGQSGNGGSSASASGKSSKKQDSAPKKQDPEPATGSYYRIVKRNGDGASKASGTPAARTQVARSGGKTAAPDAAARVNQRPATQVASRQTAREASGSPRLESRLVEATATPDKPDHAPARKPVVASDDPLPPVAQSADNSPQGEIPMTAYKVGADDKIDSIAKEFGTTPAELRRMNHMRSFDNPIPNGFIYVPWVAPALN